MNNNHAQGICVIIIHICGFSSENQALNTFCRHSDEISHIGKEKKNEKTLSKMSLNSNKVKNKIGKCA